MGESAEHEGPSSWELKVETVLLSEQRRKAALDKVNEALDWGGIGDRAGPKVAPPTCERRISPAPARSAAGRARQRRCRRRAARFPDFPQRLRPTVSRRPENRRRPDLR